MKQNQKINQPFHSKYRPHNLNTVLGQDHIISYFKVALINKRLNFAYLFFGKHGVGKTTMSRIIAKSLNCSSPNKLRSYEPCNRCINCININKGKAFDLYEINAAMNTGIDNIRELIEKIQLSPVNNAFKVCILDEVHMLSPNAFNALLKILEEPPKNVIFMLITTDVKRVPNTIISRCHKLCFLPITKKDLAISINNIIFFEKGNITNNAIQHIINTSEGSFRDAINIVDMLMTKNKNITQTYCSFLLTETSYSLSYLFLKYLISKDIRKIMQIYNYFEEKTWLVSSLIKQMKIILQDIINNKTNLFLTDSYLVHLWQLLIKYDISFSCEEILSLFISDLILLFSKTNFLLTSDINLKKKKIPTMLKMSVVYIYQC
tara:strand:+ start:67 stop:1197 length:1131 start_codon:yes stop_codon:yes gene_type:complete